MRVCMVCNFFYPRAGGVENHVWALANHLVALKHTVVIVTHAYRSSSPPSTRCGVRYMGENRIKVYYCPFVPFYDENTWPTLTAKLPLVRKILIRENIDVVHAHQASSVLALESLLTANLMGIRTVYTDHSLFGLGTVDGIHLNKVVKFAFSNLDEAIAVSNVCRENLVLRSCIDPAITHRVPNAMDPNKFTPDISNRPNKDEQINIVVVSRLVYRKGTDLLCRVMREVCLSDENVNFIVGGDGNKKILLDEMREKNGLEERITLLGGVPHEQVSEVLSRGHIFLNTSLTESFCIAILEAACCGLFVCSTKVGGVSEVLESDMIEFGEPTCQSMVAAVHRSISKVREIEDMDTYTLETHERVRTMYSWSDVASQTEKIYENSVVRAPTMLARIKNWKSVGSYGGWVAVFLGMVIFFWLKVVEVIEPEWSVEKCVDFDVDKSQGKKSRKRVT